MDRPHDALSSHARLTGDRLVIGIDVGSTTVKAVAVITAMNEAVLQGEMTIKNETGSGIPDVVDLEVEEYRIKMPKSRKGR